MSGELLACPRCAASLAEKAAFCPHCGLELPEGALENATLSFSRNTAQPLTLAHSASVYDPEVEMGESNTPFTDPPSGSMAAWRPGIQGLTPGEVFAGRFKLDRLLGNGALCGTFLVRDTQQGDAIGVLKILQARKAADSETARDFMGLASAVSQYNAPGIAKIYEVGQFEGIPWYFMEYLTGQPMRLWLLERQQLENRVLPGIQIIRQLVEIFNHVHELGCHGALKPENIFITETGPVISDFGVPGFLSAQEFEFNAYARRYLPYMAPELRRDFSNLLPQSDYFSMGALLYEVLTGRAPSQPLRLPSEVSPVFGIEADELILKALSPQPQDRFGSSFGFIGALESLRGDLLLKRPDLQSSPLPNATSPLSPVHRNKPKATPAHAITLIPDQSPLETTVFPVAKSTFSPNLGARNEGERPFTHEGQVVPLAEPIVPPTQAPWEKPALELRVTPEPTPSTDPAAPLEQLPPLDVPENFETAVHASSGAVKRGVSSPWSQMQQPIGNVTYELPENTLPEGYPKKFDEDWLASEPTPLWLWLALVLMGLALTVIAAWLGFQSSQ